MSSDRRWPYLTVAILVGSVLLYAAHGQVLLEQLAASGPIGRLLSFLLHPFAHNKEDVWHIVGDIGLGFFVMGTLIESWVALGWKYRYQMYGLSYVSSLLADVMMWKWRGAFIGLSGFVCAGIAFLIAYYVSSFRNLPMRRLRDTLGPLGVGYLIPFVVTSILLTLSYPQNLSIQNTAIYHCVAFSLGFVLAVDLLLRTQLRDMLRRCRHITSHHPTKGLL